ncbi:hypothetical protein LXL04_002015 [Taraxacum kok-saghyz]
MGVENYHVIELVGEGSFVVCGFGVLERCSRKPPILAFNLCCRFCNHHLYCRRWPPCYRLIVFVAATKLLVVVVVVGVVQRLAEDNRRRTWRKKRHAWAILAQTNINTIT